MPSTIKTLLKFGADLELALSSASLENCELIEEILDSIREESFQKLRMDSAQNSIGDSEIKIAADLLAELPLD